MFYLLGGTIVYYLFSNKMEKGYYLLCNHVSTILGGTRHVVLPPISKQIASGGRSSDRSQQRSLSCRSHPPAAELVPKLICGPAASLLFKHWAEAQHSQHFRSCSVATIMPCVCPTEAAVFHDRKWWTTPISWDIGTQRQDALRWRLTFNNIAEPQE